MRRCQRGDVIRCGESVGVGLVFLMRRLGRSERSSQAGSAGRRYEQRSNRSGGSAPSCRLSSRVRPVRARRARRASSTHGAIDGGRSLRSIALPCPHSCRRLSCSGTGRERSLAPTMQARGSLGRPTAAPSFLMRIPRFRRSRIQPKLLRVLEQREVLPLGETKPVPIDVRVIAATQEPLSSAVKDRRFRPDLHARLDGLTIVLPPLRSRREDITPLFQEFLQQEAEAMGPPSWTRSSSKRCAYTTGRSTFASCSCSRDVSLRCTDPNPSLRRNIYPSECWSGLMRAQTEPSGRNGSGVARMTRTNSRLCWLH